MPYKDPEKQREYARRWMASRRAAFFDGKCCVRCQSTSQLELDHIDPSQKVSHKIWSWSEAKRNVELAKCQVLCKKCHALKTAEFLRVETLHGTHSGYASGCRCSPCTKGHARYLKEWRSAR